MRPSREHPWKGRRNVPEAWEGTIYGLTVGFSMAMGSEGRPNASCIDTYGKHGYPSDLHFSRRKKGHGVGTSPLGGTKWVGTVASLIAMWCPSLGTPLGRSKDPTQPVPSLRVLPYGTFRNRKWTGFSRFYGFLGVGPWVEKLFPCYLMGFCAIFATMGPIYDPLGPLLGLEFG
jgi:hypothetical protein